MNWSYDDRDSDGRTFDVAPDGSRSLTTKAVGEEPGDDAEPAPELRIRIVLNWTQQLLERVPVD